ncbi:MAG: hypothetical protein QM820_27355 [Minicystis sp.]
MNRRAIMSISLAAVLLPAAGALAFPFGKSWHDRADGTQTNGGRAGAGGIYGMGSASDHGITCANCHIGGAGQIGATVTPTPAFQKVNNADAYKPGQTYAITVTMTGEHLGLNQGNDNLNGMAFTIEDAGGKVKGVFTSDADPTANSTTCKPSYPAQNPATGTTYIYGDCHGMIFIPRPNATSWTFTWKAPAAGTGPLNVFYGVVDGDHDGKSSEGDDVKMGSAKLLEGT